MRSGDMGVADAAATTPARAGHGRPPGRAWYAVAGLVALATVAITGALAFGRVLDLVDRVEGYQRFSAPGGLVVEAAEPGRYGVYHEYAGPVADPSEFIDFRLAVTGPEGAPVEVEPSGVTYGWRDRHGDAIGEFEAESPGPYQVTAESGYGQVAVGERMPGGSLRGFGGTLVAATAVLGGCLVLAVVVAWRRRTAPAVPPTPGGFPTGPPDRRAGWVGPVLALAAIVVVVGGLAAVAVGAQAVSERASDVGMTGLGGAGEWPAVSPETAPEGGPEVDCTEMSNIENGLCGPTPEELRETNLSYADRLPFAGSSEAAAAASTVAEDVRAALTPLAAATPSPSPDDVRAALAPWGPEVVVSTNAVRTAGTAFAVSVDGGCVFGAVHDGQVEVEVGGYVTDGGCLAEYGH